MSETQVRTGPFSSRFNRRQALKGAGVVGLAAAAAPVFGARAMAMGVPLAQDAAPKSGGTLTVGLQADPTALDAQKQSLTAIWHVVEHMYEGLVGIGADLAPYPLLAESWEVSEDGLTVTFNLREGVLFHDGATMTSADVEFTYKRVLDPAIASTSASNLLGLVGAEEFNTGAATELTGLTVVDEKTIQLTLTAPDASLLVVLAEPSVGILNQAFTEANGNDLSQIANGTGPFSFVEYIPNTSVTLEKHTEYWQEGLPYVDGMEMLIVPTDVARTASLVQGQTDFIEYSPLADVQMFIDDADNYTVTGDSNTNIRYMAFNFDVEPLANLQVRQAIAMAVDRGPIVDSAVFGFGTAVETIFPPDFWAALPVEVPAQDIEGAKALLAEAGYADGFDTMITSWAQYSFLSNAAVVLQEQLKQIGINAELNLVENATMIADVHTPSSKNFELGVTGTSAYIDPHPLISRNFLTGGTGNTMNYSNPDVDALIEQGMIESDLEARAEIYRQIQQHIIDDLPWLSLFVANQFEAMKTDVKGYVHMATGSNRFLKETWLDR
ncbi:MAG: ABC transporter substrate-binding protein [Thermomicrobiales bacterium]